MSTENGLTVVEQPRTQGAVVLRESLREASEQRVILAEYVAKHMTEGTDYGKIPGTDKPTLLKPGAEKLVDLFRCTPKFALISKEEDFERGFFNYMFRVRLYSRDADAVLAEGFGSANSREGRYRWRIANRKCPSCGKEAIIAGKQEYGGGWLCFKKKGGCGAKFDAMAQEITSQAQGQVENEDIATLANTILKMAKKRALVDGAIALARCSDLFTQDVEDLVDHGPPTEAPPTAPAPKPEAKPPPPPKMDAAVAEFQKNAAVTCAKEGHVWSLKGVCEGCGAKETPAQAKTQSPENVTRARRIWTTALSRGITREGFGKWVELQLGKAVPSAQWTPDDMSRLEVSLQEPPAEPGAAG